MQTDSLELLVAQLSTLQDQWQKGTIGAQELLIKTLDAIGQASDDYQGIDAMQRTVLHVAKMHFNAIKS